MDPVGFEPTISCLQSRRLPAWPRARTLYSSADERTRTSTPLRAIDPKSIASANSATSASPAVNCPAPTVQSGLASLIRLAIVRFFRLGGLLRQMYSRFCHRSAAWRPPAVIICLRPLGLADCNLPGVIRPRSLRCDEILHCFCKRCKTHTPCSPLHARPAGPVSKTAGGLLPHPFTPHLPSAAGRTGGGSALCCGCSHMAVTGHAPPLTVSWGNAPLNLPGSVHG